MPARREPQRRRLPETRAALTYKFEIGAHEGYITAGMYEDGTSARSSSTTSPTKAPTLNGMVNACAMAISVALQYGAPLETIAAKYTHMRFEPSGDTDNPRIPRAKSIPDYAARWLASIWCEPDVQAVLGIGPDPAVQPELPLHVVPSPGRNPSGPSSQEALSDLGHVGRPIRGPERVTPAAAPRVVVASPERTTVRVPAA